MKICKKCNQEKPLDQFSKRKDAKDGLNYHCKTCRTEYNKKHYENNSEKVKEDFKKYYKNNTHRYKEHYNQWRKDNPERFKELLKKTILSIPPGVYKVTCLITGDFYIGQSVKPYERKTQHFTIHKEVNNNNTNTALQLAVRQYGKEKFTFEIIEHCKPEQLLERESYWIKQLNPTYNINLS